MYFLNYVFSMVMELLKFLLMFLLMFLYPGLHLQSCTMFQEKIHENLSDVGKLGTS